LTPEIHYVKTADGAHIAYTVLGEGSFDLVFVPGFASNVEHMWSIEPIVSAIRRMASFARVIVFDRRGTGLSDRFDEANLPTLEARMDDFRAVLDAADAQRAAVFGHEDGAVLCAVFAATYPSRVFGAILHATAARGLWAPDYPWGWTSEQWDEYLERVDLTWGTEEFTQYTVGEGWPSHASDTEFQRSFTSYLRSTASPGAALAFERLFRDTDIRDVLATIQVPVLVMHSTHDRVESVECARHLAAHIPGARLVEFSDDDHYLFADTHLQPALETVERFLISALSEEIDTDRVLATVLFADIVGSTEAVETMGDKAWRDLLAEHNQRVHAILGRFRGREVDTAGDGVLAVFDGPARAVKCGFALREAAQPLGLRVRVGIHAGEVELDGPAVRGIAVHIGARVAGKAAADEVLVSSTVRDLVAGSGLEFEDRGEHDLKGIPGTWRLFGVLE
jgi:class 3 adenylate cyclase